MIWGGGEWGDECADTSVEILWTIWKAMWICACIMCVFYFSLSFSLSFGSVVSSSYISRHVTIRKQLNTKVNVFLCVCLRMCVSVCVYPYVCVHMCACVRACANKCMHVCLSKIRMREFCISWGVRNMYNQPENMTTIGAVKRSCERRVMGVEVQASSGRQAWNKCLMGVVGLRTTI